MSKPQIAVTLPTVLTVAAVVLLSVLLWQLQSLIVILMTSAVVAASIAPIVTALERVKLPRWLATIFAFLGLIATATGIVLIVGPPVIAQIEQLIKQLPTLSEQTIETITEPLQRLTDTQPELLDQLFDTQSIAKWTLFSSRQVVLKSYGITRGIVGATFSLILAIFLSGYMVADSRTLIRSVTQIFPEPWDDRLESQMGVVGERMGGYIRGRVLVSSILAIATAAGLSFLGLEDYALGLGAIAGVTNLIPFLGPFLGAIPALIVALSQGGLLVFWVLLLFVIIQNVETYVLDPLLVGSSVGVHPLFQLLSVLGGVQVLGIIGALIVPPWFAGVSALVDGLYLQPKRLLKRTKAIEAKLVQPSSASS
ncbi:MAG: AI-2E family transporter [Geitlerinemataceae cyanobacterium]